MDRGNLETLWDYQ